MVSYYPIKGFLEGHLPRLHYVLFPFLIRDKKGYFMVILPLKKSRDTDRKGERGVEEGGQPLWS